MTVTVVAAVVGGVVFVAGVFRGVVLIVVVVVVAVVALGESGCSLLCVVCVRSSCWFLVMLLLQSKLL